MGAKAPLLLLRQTAEIGYISTRYVLRPPSRADIGKLILELKKISVAIFF